MMGLASTTARPAVLTAQTQQTKTQQQRRPAVIRCAAAQSSEDARGATGAVKQLARAAGTAALAASLMASPALAELNKFESRTTGEFNVGTAQQYGGTDSDSMDFRGQDLRRSNFTSASLKGAKFNNANLKGAYFIKAVVAQADFTGADVSDVLFDRAVLVEANLTDAVFTRTVFTLSDFRDAVVDGADFTDALLDKPQTQALCKYAKGTNPVTGVSTRKSLGCGGGRRGSPSAYMTDERVEKPEAAFDPSVFNNGSKQATPQGSNPF